MYESMLEEFDRIFPNKALLTKEEVAEALGCQVSVVYNWIRKIDPARRAPAFMVGKDVRIPKRPFVRWFVDEQFLGVK